jgi:dipeptidyl aminopeptidase/acylaminoacyl peptidase
MLRRLALNDLEKFKMIAQPKISPDLDKILYLITVPEGDEYSTCLEIIDRKSGEKIWEIIEGNPNNPDWAPSGDKLLFTSRTNFTEGEKGTGLWVTKIDDKPKLLVNIKSNISQPRWSNNSEYIAFISNVGEEDSDVKIIDRIPIWFNGEGWTYNKTKHLHLLKVNTVDISVISTGDMDVQCFDISQDSSKIAYCQSANPLKPGESDLIIFNIETGVQEHVLNGYYIQSLQWSIDSKQIAFMGHNGSRGYATQVGIHLLDLEKNTVSDLIGGLDRECSRRHYYDIRSMNTRNSDPVWDNEFIYFPLSNSDKFELHRINPSTKSITPILVGAYSIEEFSVKKGVIVYTRVTSDSPAELWVKAESNRKITSLNDELIKNVTLKQPERFSFTQKDGADVEGWIIKPNNENKEEKYPAVVDIHGGPKSKFGNSLMFEHQLLSAHGYAVIYLNIRGSGGYSQEFGDIRGDWGNWDFADLLAGVNKALELYPWIDGDRLGVTGLSYGGFMTNWVITHSDIFKAAISQNSISSWTAFFGTSDIGFHFTPEQIGSDPWNNLDTYINKSPITYADKVTTPVLFIHSWEDYRCWIDQSIEFFTALKYLGKETQLAMFMEGPHTFRSVAKLILRKQRYQLMLDWFDRYLKN